jgi:hypothetical protein
MYLNYEPNHKDKDCNPDGPSHPWQEMQSFKHDVNSIIQYPSFFCAREGVNEITATVHNSVLVAWKQGGPGFTPPMQVSDDNAVVVPADYSRGPSAGDIAGVQYAYPWEN